MRKRKSRANEAPLHKYSIDQVCKAVIAHLGVREDLLSSRTPNNLNENERMAVAFMGDILNLDGYKISEIIQGTWLPYCTVHKYTRAIDEIFFLNRKAKDLYNAIKAELDGTDE